MTPGEHNMRALRQTNAKGAAFAVLAVMLHALDFRTLTARMSRDTIHDLTGLDPKTIKRALASLRASGDLQAVSYATGGRNRTPVYRFPHAHTLETGGDMPPLLPDDETQKGGHLVPKGGASGPKRGGERPPPSSYRLVRGGEPPEEEKDGPSRPEAIQAQSDPIFTTFSDAMRSKRGGTWWHNWGRHLTHGTRHGETYRLYAGTRFRARKIGQEYGEEIAALIRSVAPDIRRVDVIPTPEKETA